MRRDRKERKGKTEIYISKWWEKGLLAVTVIHFQNIWTMAK